MNDAALEKQVREFMRGGRFAEAEELLLKARRDAADASNPERLKLVLDLLVDVYSLREPRDIPRADAACLAREELAQTAYSKLQTAMVRYWAGHDYQGAIVKAREAISEGKKEQDDSTVYTALSLLGLGLMQVGDHSGVTDIIDQIEQMIDDNRHIIVGDETSFLESAQSRGVSVAAIARIAARLAPLCRDPEFAKRLHALARV